MTTKMKQPRFIYLLSALLSLPAYSSTIEHRMSIPALVETAVSPEPNLTLAASPETIRLGSQATLSWVGHKLSGVTFSDIGYQKGESGQRVVAPTSDTVYVASGENLHGSTQSQATVTVLDPEPTWSASTHPQIVFPNQSVTIKWQTQYASDVSLEGVGTVATNGEYTTQLGASQSFNFTLIGDQITTLETETVTVTPRDNRTCKTLLDQDPTLPSGAYDLSFGTYSCDMTTQGGGWLRIPVTDLAAWRTGQTLRHGRVTHHANGEITITDSVAEGAIDVRFNYRLPFNASMFMLGTLIIQDESPTTGHTFDVKGDGDHSNVAWTAGHLLTDAGDVAYGSVDDSTPAVSFVGAGHATSGHLATFTLPSNAQIKPFSFSQPTNNFNVRVVESGPEWEGIRIHKSGYVYFR